MTDYGDKLDKFQGNWIFLFGKHKGRKMKTVPTNYLQWMLERWTDLADAAGKTGICILAGHDSHADLGEVIDGANSKAVEIRWKGQWLPMDHRNLTVKDCVDRVFNFVFKHP